MHHPKSNKNGIHSQQSSRMEQIATITASIVSPSLEVFAREFAHAYFSNAAEVFFLGRSDDVLASIAASHLEMALAFNGGQAAIRATSCDGRGQSQIEIVNDDMPYIVDTVSVVLRRHGLRAATIHHPILHVERNTEGMPKNVQRGASRAVAAESYIRIELERRPSNEVLDATVEDLKSSLAQLRTVLEDYARITDRCDDLARRLDNSGDSEEAAFLRWLQAGNFVFLGADEFSAKKSRSTAGSETGIGLLGPSGSAHRSRLSQERSTKIGSPGCSVEYKMASNTSPIVPDGLLECISVTERNAHGKVRAEWCFVGFFAPDARYVSPFEIPCVRHKIEEIGDTLGIAEGSHAARTLKEIINRYSRGELLAESAESLADNVAAIIALHDRPRVALRLRIDPNRCFVVCNVFVPRQRYTTATADRVADILSEAIPGFIGEIVPQVSSSPLVRLTSVIRTEGTSVHNYNTEEIEKRLEQVMRTWEDEVEELVFSFRDPVKGCFIFPRWIARTPASYRDVILPLEAARDFVVLDGLSTLGELEARFCHRQVAGQDTVVLKLYARGSRIPLSNSLPMLERFGLRTCDHQSFEFRHSDESSAWLHDFTLVNDSWPCIRDSTTWPAIEEAIENIWSGISESDDFCRLVVDAAITWREVMLFRAYSCYLKQIGFPLVGSYAAGALTRNVGLTKSLLRLFAAMFNPVQESRRDMKVAAQRDAVLMGLSRVGSADDDRILRKYLMLIDATLRTNFYQPDADGSAKPYLSIKFDSLAIDEIPLPRPRYEVFVYSASMEGIHLRGGRVSRGGVRWSDRRGDFRTEIHGLLKAQMVKNVVIVPEGSKGGFVVKRPPAEGGVDALRREGVFCYETLVRGLLDVTDNIVDGSVVPPPNVFRRDSDDPYLVVAADKGTATFSDIANEIASEYGFWLDDAFASGGSAGYDHKKMAITARGAWESVKRHFREMDIDIQTQTFTVVGVGDMSGDVFGNGMLLSRCIHLIGAFDHRHIFIDPDPDPKTSFNERRRLFELPHSSWADYDQSLISDGGGIYERTAKTVHVSDRVRALLGISSAHTTPNELIRALLCAQVDLLWLGGIGTYIKASTEMHEQVGDRACDAIRVNAAELHCRVIGEGANLGVTQMGRIEFEFSGGRVNTDAIDNAGGVNCSDHEVNIKILLNQAMLDGAICREDRNTLLREMTGEVAALVLRDNYLQSQALSVAQAFATETLDRHQRLIRYFERTGLLDRKVAGLPDDEHIAVRRAGGIGLTRPELAVLLAYTKISLKSEIISSDLPDDPLFFADLVAYFPSALRERFHTQIAKHPLRREIITTMVVNSMVNRVGSGFVDELHERTGYPDAVVARAYAVVRDIFGLQSLWDAVERLDGVVPASAQISMMLESRQLTETTTLWVLRNVPHPIDVSTIAARFRGGVQHFRNIIERILDPAGRSNYCDRLAGYSVTGIPSQLARDTAALPVLQAALDIVLLAEKASCDIEDLAKRYFEIRARLGIPLLLASAATVPQRDGWESRAVRGVIDTLVTSQRNLVTTLDVSRVFIGGDFSLDSWLSKHKHRCDAVDGVIAELGRGVVPSLSMLAVASQEILALSQEHER